MVERGSNTEAAHNQESILSRAFTEVILQGARENLSSHGCLGTTLLIGLDNGERGVVPLSLPGTFEEKQFYFSTLGISFLKSGRQIQEAILVSESWYVKAPENDYHPNTAPSQHPQRKEAITLVGRDIFAQHFVFAIQPFHRDQQNKPVFEPLELEHFEEQPNEEYYSTGLLDNLFLGLEIDNHNPYSI